MATLISEKENWPSSYPTVGSPAVADDVWQRVESYIAHRYTARTVEWVVEGCGEWVPPLKPAVVTKVEIWSRANEWDDITSDAPTGPYGFWLPASGPYRFTATVGGGSPAPTVPAVVATAVLRLSAYMTAKAGKPGVTSKSFNVGELSESYRRDASWMAMAMQNSGAADLLRGFKR